MSDLKFEATISDCKKIGSGYYEIKFKTFDQFIAYFYSDLLDFGSYIWRGHRCENWKLEPTIERLKQKLNLNEQDAHHFNNEHLERFKYAVRGRRGPNPPAINAENDWWALGQHHGLATPLLDWTTSPFVAAFFAFHELGNDQTENRAIFALHRPSIERVSMTKQFKDNLLRQEKREELERSGNEPTLASLYFTGNIGADIEFIYPFSDENQRLVNQGGLFTKNKTKLTIDDWIPEYYHQVVSAAPLIKFLIPDTERTKCLQLLNRMNINALTLFPDLTGASQYCNLFAEVKNY